MKKTIFISIFIFHLSFFIQLNAQIISTYTGNGIGGYSGDGGLATAAEINTPTGIALDTLGNLYIVDLGDDRVQKVTASTGIISTIAGGGTGLGMGDGGYATAARLFNPNGVAIDDSGNIYIADVDDYVIRKVTVSTGIINTVAGTPGVLNRGYAGNGGFATAASLDLPQGLALDDSDNIYIADYYNNVVRKVTVSTGIITTVVGNGYGHWQGAGTYTGGYTGDRGPATAAELHGPTGVSLDDSANIYISDAFNNVIRKVTVSTGIITTVAGNGINGYNGNGGAATSAEITVDGVSLDKQGNIYIADGNYDVREVNITTNIINTVAGNGVGGFSGDGGPATAAELAAVADVVLDPAGNLYIADQGNNVIRKVTYDTNTVTGVTKLIAKGEEVRMFPNPNNGTFNLYLSNVSNKCNIEIFNYLGENIYQAKINFGNTEINLSGQPNGVYLFRVLQEDGKLVGEGKVIIEK